MEEMKERIVEKLDAEYECFFQDMMRTSKENLFANSAEIESKKAIQNILRNEVKTNPKFDDLALVKKMLYTDNLIATLLYCRNGRSNSCRIFAKGAAKE